MQLCNVKFVKLSMGIAISQLYNFTIMQFRNFAISQFRNFAISQFCNFAILQFRNFTILQFCRAIMQLCNVKFVKLSLGIAISQLYNFTIMQFCNFVEQFCNFAILQFYKIGFSTLPRTMVLRGMSVLLALSIENLKTIFGT